MKIKIMLLCCLLSGCSYRYGTGYFSNDIPPATAPAAYPVATAQPEPVAKKQCDGEKTTKLEVVNKLDSKNQTLTTDVTETRSASESCQ